MKYHGSERNAECENIMSVATGDYNLDSRPDIFIASGDPYNKKI